MSDNTKIEWADATWNVIVGCEIVSTGCRECYAMRLAGGRMKSHPTRDGLTVETKAGPVWNGKTRWIEKVYRDPLKWSRPRKIFVGAHTDLFYKGVKREWLVRTFAMMALTPHHTYIVLTKRADAMREILSSREFVVDVYDYVCDSSINEALNVTLIAPGTDEKLAPKGSPRVRLGLWPLPNVWLGISAERQPELEERLPDLLLTPAAVRGISAEPLLGPLDISLRRDRLELPPGLHFVIAGGESGPSARPARIGWVRSLRDQCKATGVHFSFKQWGEWAPDSAGEFYHRVGKKAAGRMLDGVIHDDYPPVRHAKD